MPPDASDGIAKLFVPLDLSRRQSMQISSSMPRLKGFRFPREVVAYAVWAYHCFALSAADVEDPLAERGIIVSREAIRLWVNGLARILRDVSAENAPGQMTSGTSMRL